MNAGTTPIDFSRFGFRQWKNFSDKIEVLNEIEGCWIWKASNRGFGFGWPQKTYRACRFAYEMWCGPIPPKMTVDQKCGDPFCVNPSHMELVEQKALLLRGNGGGAKNARKTHCINGHDLTDPSNVSPYFPGRRRCVICMAEARKKYQDRIKSIPKPIEPPKPKPTHCKVGHELTEGNYKDVKERRDCLICKRLYDNARNAKKREGVLPKKRGKKPQPKPPIIYPARNKAYDLTSQEREEFLKKIEGLDPKQCWPWPGWITNNGYGMFTVVRSGKQRHLSAHRITAEMKYGQIDRTLVVDHKCRNRSCVNPDHLEPVTYQENTLRGLVPIVAMMKRIERDHCHKGHPLNEDNLIIYLKPSGHEERRCRTCSRENGKKYRAIKKAARQAQMPIPDCS